MCGIAGFINLTRQPVNEHILWSMTDALAHRGPDGRGIYVDGFVGLGHRRLSIIDLSARARQPMKTETGDCVITYNGEVYNFKALRRSMQAAGEAFRSDSDTEVVLKSFASRGFDSLAQLNGMFAFAVWDRKNKTVTLARDRYGIKPLYYWHNSDVFLFASEIKAFLKHPGFAAEVDPEALLEYFTFQNTFTYRTLFKGVKLLPPGQYMRIALGNGVKIETKRYWDFCFQEDTGMRSEEEYQEELDRLFTQAVTRQSVSDVEIGSYLSGGIDSGAIVAATSRHFKDLKTFCVGFDVSRASGLEVSFDERKKAEALASLHRTEHYEMILKSGDMQKCLPDLVWSLEDLRLGQSYPNFYAAKLASRFVKVCFSGAGGDELFAGYPWRYYRALKSKNFDEYIEGYYKYWHRLIPNRVLHELFLPIADRVKGVWTQDIFKKVVFEHAIVPQTPEDYINNSLYFEAKTFLHGLCIVEDKLSMANSLEVRVPFLDNDLVDFAMKIPLRLKLKDIDTVLNIDENELAKREKYFELRHDGKMILRKALGKYVGIEAVNRHKQGFSGPDATWFKGESINYVKELLFDPKAHIYHYFDYKTVGNLVNEHLDGKCNRRLFIWSLLSFEWWCRIFLGSHRASAVCGAGPRVDKTGVIS